MPSTDSISVLDGFRNRRVLVTGDVMLDRYLWGTVTRLSPEAPVPILAKQRNSSLPGGAANVAVNIAALGGDAILVIATGDGPEALELQAALAERGVNPANVVLSSNRRTTVKTRIIAHSQHLLRVDEEHSVPIDLALSEELFQRIDAALPSVDAIILSDYAKGVLTSELLSRVIAKARHFGLPVIVDPKGQGYSRYNGATLLTPNRSEAFLAAGVQPDSGSTTASVGRHLMDAIQIDALLITEGEQGMTLFEQRDFAIHLAAAGRAVYDVTGAGDTVVATMGLALGAGGSLRTATYLANLAGGLAVEQVGTATVTSAMLGSLLADPGHSMPSFSEFRLAKGAS
jgi:D-beta-D-heptose 7-phosphate kinase/D-beta-D-heptose 1-phosphate adenosyltransferase